MKNSNDYVKKHRKMAAKNGMKRVESTIHKSHLNDYRSLVKTMKEPKSK